MMFLRQLVAFLFDWLTRFRFLFAALGILFLTFYGTWSSSEVILYAAVGVALLGVRAFFSVRIPPKNRMSRRRLMEAGICLLLALHLALEESSLSWVSYLHFPLFLVFVYAGYRGRMVLGLYLFYVFLESLRFANWAQVSLNEALPLLFMGLWALAAWIFRAQEKLKREEIRSRLDFYEREASSLGSKSSEVESSLRVTEKKEAHLAAMIREREKTFRELLELLHGALGTYTCALYFYDPLEESFLLKDFLTQSDIFSEKKSQPLHGIFRALVKEKDPITLRTSSDAIRGLIYYKGASSVKSVLAAPLLVEGVLRGALIADRKENSPFDGRNLELFERVRSQLSRAIESAESVHAHFHLKEELSAFFSASRALNQSLKVGDVLRKLLEATRKIAPFDWGVVVLFDDVLEENRIAAEEGDLAASQVGVSFSAEPEKSLVSWVIGNKMPLSYSGFRSRKGKARLFGRGIKIPNRYDSILILPLIVKEESLGALLLASGKRKAFSSPVRKMLEVISLMAAVSYKNARMVGELEKLAITDGLTGLLNHRSFQETLASELERSQRHPTEISLLMVDIDYFKKINDEYGHPVGDFVLKQVSQVLRETVRKVDVVSRYGGEEFAVLLLHTGTKGAALMADRIGQAVRKKEIRHAGHRFHVTVSLGVATHPKDADRRETLIQKADQALYESKRAGRNRATVYNSALAGVSSDVRETHLIDAVETEIRESGSIPLPPSS